MGQFNKGDFGQQKDAKQRFVKGTENQKTKAFRWSHWIAEAIFYPEYKNKSGTKVGHIIIKFRPYFSKKSKVLFTYTPAIMLNKTETYFWKFMNGGRFGSVGKFYWNEKRLRDSAISKHIKGKIKHKPLTSKTGKAILEYNRKEAGLKYHYIQNKQISYIGGKKARRPLQRQLTTPRKKKRKKWL